MSAIPVDVEAPAEPKSRKKLILIGIVVAVLAAAAVWLLFLSGDPAEASDAPPVEGPIVPLEAQTTTLGEDGIHHARVALAVVLTEGSDPVQVTDRAPLLQDALLGELAGMNADAVRSAEGSDQLRSRLTAEAHAIWDEETVLRVVLTELMVQ